MGQLALQFALRYWREALIGILVTTLVLEWKARDRALVQSGVDHQLFVELEDSLARHQPVAARADSVVRVDTIRLRPALAHYDTVREQLPVHDTVLVAAADHAVQACRATVLDLVTSCAAKDGIIRDLRGELALKPATITVHDSVGASWKERLTWALLGAVVGRESRGRP